MENASKALLIAGGMLIAILVISLFAYLFANMGGYAEKTHEIVETNRISQFNNQFTKYYGRTDLKIQDVLTITNLAINNNTSYNLTAADANDNTYYVKVMLGTRDLTQNPIDENTILEKIKNGNSYACKEIRQSQVTKRVNSITIKEF